jgi:hypothetical protein
VLLPLKRGIMGNHEARWARQPEVGTGSIGQYYCSKCKLELDVGYGQNRDNESCTGWHWEIEDHSGHGRNASAGTSAAKYVVDPDALDEVKAEGLARFDSFPCLRSN